MGDNIMDRAEFWVMRLWVARPVASEPYPVTLEHMTATAQVATLAMLAAGKLAQLPGGIIAEPVEVFDAEPDAHAYRMKLIAKHPGEVFRVVMNAGFDL